MVNTITKGIHKVIQEKGCCNMKKNTIICISREFGSGGREIGQQLSKKLGIPFYDKEILARVAEESDMSEEFVRITRRMQSTATLSMSRSDTDFQALTQKRS